MALSAMISGLKDGRFLFSIGKNLPSTLSELISRTQKYINDEEFFSSRKSNQTCESSSKGKSWRDEESQCADKRRSDDNASRDRRPSRRPESKFSSYTPLNMSPEQILIDIQDQSHNTSDCIDLKEEIETLIRKGHLRQYVKEERQNLKDDQLHKVVKETTEIRTIYKGPSGGGDLNRAHKAHSKSSDLRHYIYLVERPRKELRVSPYSLTFTEHDMRGIQHPYDDALVVAMTIATHKVYRILVDTGSSADILYSEAFDKMRIDMSRLRPVKTPLHGFARIR
ncbi:uncharacterized protein LOC131228781 [Magnolia sinica]|uniref:uncharacterized protein LOC131228781 n=1 Tax=Magnolia sinica TaxID=86752 RepID=UPI002659E7E9|nr:uncharacterized protein LOC131228781 [Magnolia sinica]